MAMLPIPFPRWAVVGKVANAEINPSYNLLLPPNALVTNKLNSSRKVPIGVTRPFCKINNSFNSFQIAALFRFIFAQFA